MTSARRRTATAAAVAVLGVLAGTLALLVPAAPAQASSYRYWTYWWGKPDATGWRFANLGPAGRKVADRSVEGWRFAVSTTTGGKQPRTSASYADHCSDPAVDGKVRAAVVVDYGTAADAPPGQTPPGGGTVRVECLTLPAGSTGLDALRAAGVSYDIQKGLVCSLDSYPRGECAAVVADPTPTPTKTPASPKPTPSTSRTTATAPTSTTPAAGSATSARPIASTGRTSAPATTSAPAAATSAPAVDVPSTTASPEAEPTLPVSSGSPLAAAPAQDGGGSAGGFIVGALVALGIGGAAWWTARGRSA